MKRAWNVFAILLSISAAFAADKDKGTFRPEPAASYPIKQSQDKVTVAAVPYVNDDEVRTAFGKSDPNKYGFLPVLVIIQNDSNKALRLDLKTEYVDASGRHIESIPASELPYIAVPPKRNDVGGKIPLPTGPLGRRSKKNPLSGWEIEGRSFSARMLPAGESVHGFFYFQARPEPGASLYLTGIQEASSGREFFYFEIPLDAKK
jgi:hypothetical protein